MYPQDSTSFNGGSNTIASGHNISSTYPKTNSGTNLEGNAIVLGGSIPLPGFGNSTPSNNRTGSNRGPGSGFHLEDPKMGGSNVVVVAALGGPRSGRFLCVGSGGGNEPPFGGYGCGSGYPPAQPGQGGMFGGDGGPPPGGGYGPPPTYGTTLYPDDESFTCKPDFKVYPEYKKIEDWATWCHSVRASTCT